MNKYMNVISEGPLMVIRCPGTLHKDGEVYATPQWKYIVKGVYAILKSYGLKRKDLYSLDPAGAPGDDTYLTYEAAYAGEDKLGAFHLYDWDEIDQGFLLVRASTRSQ